MKDVTDFFEAGGTPKGLMELVREAPLWTPGSTSSSLYPEKSEKYSECLQAVPLSDFMASGNTAIPWVVESIFPAEGAGILGGYSGWGKTFVLMDLAIDVAMGLPWLNRYPTAKGTVLYIDEEGADALNRHRFQKLLAGKSLNPNAMDMHLSIGQGLLFDNPESEAKLRATLARLKPSFVIVDALIRVFSGEENSASDMRDVFGIIKRVIREHHCFILFADHQGKQLQIPPGLGSSNPKDVRGSSEKRAFVDSMLNLDKKGDVLFVEHSKSRHGMAVDSFAIRIEDNAENTMTMVSYVERADELKQASRLAPAFGVLESQFTSTSDVSRKDLISAGKEIGISERCMEEALVVWCKDKIKKVYRNPDSGPGGKKVYYVRQSDTQPSENNSFHPGTSISVEKNYSTSDSVITNEQAKEVTGLAAIQQVFGGVIRR